ncbi:MAG: MptD family putative ECF transporter S component [[Clostridium] leptum]
MESKKVIGCKQKDLINIGIFTAIYFVIFFAGMMLGYIPIFIPLLGLVCPILCGIPFMLYLTKVKKFGMVSLTGIILGLLNLIMGKRCAGSDFWHHLWCPGRCHFAGRKISKLEVHTPWQRSVFPLDYGLCEPDVFDP